MQLFHRQSGIRIVVAVPQPVTAPALHVCRYPVEEPLPPRWLHVARPRLDAHQCGALSAEELFLPEDMVLDRWMLAPPRLETGLASLWTLLPDVPLTVPVGVRTRREFDQGWGVETTATPGATGSLFTPAEHAAVAWAVLARAERVEAVALLAWIACLIENSRRDPRIPELLIGIMAPPEPHTGRLLAATRGSQHLFDPKALRWIIAELAAVDTTELEARAVWEPVDSTGEDLLASAWFPWLRSSRRASVRDVLMATWLLHDDFHGAEATFKDPDGILAGITALGYATAQEGAWLPKLERWSKIWAVPDSDPAVQAASHSPSMLRSLLTTQLGLTPMEWLAGTWLVCLRWWDRAQRLELLRIAASDLFTTTIDGRQVELSPAYTAAFEAHVVGDLTMLGAEIRRNAPGYSGLGTVPQTDLVACRNRPVIRLPDGTLVPMSLELVADRAVVLWRFLLPAGLRGARSGIAALGHQFEAYVTNLLTSQIGLHHRVLTESDIGSVLGGATRCDQVVVAGHDWLFIESSMITLSRAVAGGNLAAVDDVCDRYHAEGDQAAETAKEAEQLAAAFALPPPRATAILVVTDNPITHTPALMRRMWERRPDRNPRFVCSIKELEALVGLSSIGWSMPGAILRWQRQGVEGPLQSTVREMSGIAAGATVEASSVEEWMARLPLATPSAA